MGICGGDWARIEETWDMRMYLAVHRYWKTVAPPAIVSLAVMIKFEGKEEDPGAWVANSPSPENPRLRGQMVEGEQLISSMPGGVAVSPEGFMFGPPLPPPAEG